MHVDPSSQSDSLGLGWKEVCTYVEDVVNIFSVSRRTVVYRIVAGLGWDLLVILKFHRLLCLRISKKRIINTLRIARTMYLYLYLYP